MSELEKVQLIKQLKIYDFEYENIKTIVDILVSRNFLVSGILKASPESRQAVDYLLEFWDYDKSPYREERAAPFSEELRDALLHMADFNPRRCIDKENSFVFFGKNAIKPVNQRLFNKYLNRALEDCGYPNPEKIRFHCWRHTFCTEVKTLIYDDRYWQINADFPDFFCVKEEFKKMVPPFSVNTTPILTKYQYQKPCDRYVGQSLEKSLKYPRTAAYFTSSL